MKHSACLRSIDVTFVLSAKLPFSVRVLLESAIRNCDGFAVHKKDVESILAWEQTQHQSVEIPFKPARVILQDFTYVPYLYLGWKLFFQGAYQ